MGAIAHPRESKPRPDDRVADWSAMRKGTLVLVAACLLGAVWTQLAVAESTSPQATVRIAQLSPLVVTGERFRSREALRIKVTTDSGTVVRRTRASLRGRFAARFEAIHGDRCNSGISVVVRGGGGSFATKQLPQLLCPPANP
jgi:hypothetical protein